MKWIITAFVMLFSFTVFAEKNDEANHADKSQGRIEQHARDVLAATKKMKSSKQCPDKSKLMNICADVSDSEHDHDQQSYYVYNYQRKIYEASCAEEDYQRLIESENKEDEKIAVQEIVRKVSLMWNQNESEFRCSGKDFDLINGSIIKYAVKKKFTSFIDDVAQVWKINLNKVDEIDGKTVLDYTKDNIQQSEGGPNEAILRHYYDVLRKAGAKHRSEL